MRWDLISCKPIGNSLIKLYIWNWKHVALRMLEDTNIFSGH
jgi:hypothetical protein